MHSDTSRVIAVIPSLGKNLNRLNAAIESIRKNSHLPDLKIILIDNSQDGTLLDSNLVDEVIWTGLNLGWVGSLEYIRRYYEFDFLWTIQDDMTISNDVLGILLKEFDKDSKLGVASPVLIRDGLIPARTRGGIFTDKDEVKWINIPEHDMHPKIFNQNYDLCFVSGSGALWSKKALDDISGFDLNLYPLVHVDVDACFRLIENQWKIKLIVDAHVAHEIRGSTPEILGNSLHYINEDLVREKFLENKPTKNVIKNRIDNNFLFAVSKKSTYIFLDVARNAQQIIKNLEHEKSNLEKEFQLSIEINKRYEIENNNLVKSKSWKLTKPLRIVAQVIKRIKQ